MACMQWLESIGVVTLRCLWALQNDLKHNEAKFSMILMNIGVQVPRLLWRSGNFCALRYLHNQGPKARGCVNCVEIEPRYRIAGNFRGY